MNKSLQQNMLLKNNYLNNKYGIFKSIVLRKIQYDLFLKTTKKYLNLFDKTFTKQERILVAYKLFNYLLETKDIWTLINTEFYFTVKKKLIELYNDYKILKEYLILFELCCTYKKRNGTMCGKIVDGSLCKIHTKCKKNLNTRISISLPNFPINLCEIILNYSV